jgi:KipI family sensor histidine kinase inhibitor
VPSQLHPAVIAEYGDCGLLVTFTHDDRDARWDAGQALQSALLARADAGIVDVVASYDTAFVSFDLLRTDHDAVRRLIAADLSAEPVTARTAPRRFVVPTVYGGERGPDLQLVADELGIAAHELVALHTSTRWTVRFSGSPIASPMMDGPVLPASVSRNPSPRTRVAPGSVALSGHQCVIYPVPSPGGWRLIGQTPVRLFDVAADQLVAYRPGDQLHFRAVAEEEWDRLRSCRLAPEEPDEAVR